MDAYSLIVVAEDLEYLRDFWGPDISDPDIRRGSVVLRRLLVEDNYGAAWRAVGFKRQPSLIAIDLNKHVADIDPSEMVCAMAWGAHFRGILMAAPILVKGKEPPKACSPPRRADGFPGERDFSLSEFLDSTAGIADGMEVTRRDIIKYIANVKGGVHLSQKVKKAEKDLILRLSKFERIMAVNLTDGILVELMAIAQAVGQSVDAATLTREVRSRY